MSIEYTYEIIRVDEEARCMEIVYSAAGHQTMHVGARLPFDGESLETVVNMYSPVRYWEELLKPVVLPEVGASGSFTPPPVPTVEVSNVVPSPVIDITITDL